MSLSQYGDLADPVTRTHVVGPPHSDERRSGLGFMGTLPRVRAWEPEGRPQPQSLWKETAGYSE